MKINFFFFDLQAVMAKRWPDSKSVIADAAVLIYSLRISSSSSLACVFVAWLIRESSPSLFASPVTKASVLTCRSTSFLLFQIEQSYSLRSCSPRKE